MEKEIKGIVEQYLTFVLDSETYAVSVHKVREVLEMVPITRVPKMPQFMKGVLNLRGNVVPVIDLRLKFGLEEAEKTVDTSIIILEVEIDGDMILVGAITDSVQEVIELDSDTIEPAPTIGVEINNNFIDGMCQYKEGFLILLNIDSVLSVEEVNILSAKSEMLSAAAENDNKETK
ncbi:MAG: chemotaxis protein CheW [Spirochaetales bacterium]|nr:chemotaxis protein CheW [Spirochaetales bacterium]